jgi:hypothetical protein
LASYISHAVYRLTKSLTTKGDIADFEAGSQAARGLPGPGLKSKNQMNRGLFGAISFIAIKTQEFLKGL